MSTLRQNGAAPGVEAHLVAVGGQEDAFLGDAHGPGQVAVLDEVAHLAVDGDEIAGPGEVQQEFQLLLGGVARGVDVGHLLVDHLGAQAVEVVDHRGDGPFVAGDEPGGEDHQVAGTDLDLLVGLQGHAGQGAQGLALAAGGDDDGLGGRQAVQVADVDLQAGGMAR